jgi:hypothetical protein
MPRTDLVLALFLAGVTAAGRLPFRVRLLPTWDAVQFALALRDYDIVRHQPHPPGYLLYVGAGRAVNLLVGDAATALTWLGIGASAATVLLVYWLGWQMHGRATAVAAAVVLASSPLFWFHGEVPLPYTLEAACATAVAVSAWPLTTGRARSALLPAVVLGLAGGVRQSLLVALGPLWLGSARVGLGRWGPALAGLVAIAATSALWLVPMIALAGGLDRYLWASRELYESTIRPTMVWTAGGEWWQNVRGLLEAAIMGLGLFLPLLAWGMARGALRRGWGVREWFLAAWILPPLAIYATVHLGQYGYLLTVLPALSLLVARWLVGLAGAGRGWRGRAGVVWLTLAAIVLIHTAYFVGAPPVDVPEVGPATPAGERRVAAWKAFYRFRLWPHTARGLRETEGVVGAYADAIRRAFDPARTVLVTELGNPRSYPYFRHATYYLPEFPACHLRLGRFSPGYLFSPRLETMAATAGPEVALPPGAAWLVWMVDAWNPLLPRPAGLREIRLPHGRWMYALALDGGAIQHGGYRFVFPAGRGARR